MAADYINDGVYGAFNCTMFDHQVVEPELLTLDGHVVALDPPIAAEQLSPCSIWGPTCDSIDVVSKTSYLPTHRLRVGDWLRWPNMGAYTICAASQFNGFRKSIVHYTVDGDAALEETIKRRIGVA
jgi:ornithine decarboxylase